jgi:hypothetical protein
MKQQSKRFRLGLFGIMRQGLITKELPEINRVNLESFPPVSGPILQGFLERKRTPVTVDTRECEEPADYACRSSAFSYSQIHVLASRSHASFAYSKSEPDVQMSRASRAASFTQSQSRVDTSVPQSTRILSARPRS